MNDELISVIDAARIPEMRKQTLFKVINRLGLPMTKRRNPDSRNQIIAYINKSDLELIIREKSSTINRDNETDAVAPWQGDKGVFYLIQLEPEHDPCRFKVGFATNMLERLRSLRCFAPFATVLKTWPCLKLWERTAIDSVTQNCEKIHTEVFRVRNIAQVQEKCDRFFSLMPPIDEMKEEPGN